MSSKEVKIRVTGDVSDLLKKLDMVKNSFDKLNTDKISNKGINSLIDDLSDVDKKVEKTVDSMDDLADATNKVGKKNIKVSKIVNYEQEETSQEKQAN